jgi:predicted acetyltransferase
VSSEYLSVPIDPTSAERLRRDGLRFDVVDTSDDAAFSAWLQANARGFLGPRDSEEAIAQRRGYLAYRRTTGVWDESGADAATPVATVDSWPTKLSVPGRTDIDAWAISSVSVAPTHRRRGVATALLQSELRTASSLGVPIAMLTVTESTIYGRFGFAPAVMGTNVTIDTRRVRWSGPEPAGRVQFVTQEILLADGLAIVDNVRLNNPGQIQYSGLLWERQLGTMITDETAKSLRFARYDDAHGNPAGFVIYRIIENEADFTKNELVVLSLVAATDDAYAALWRFVLEYDLIEKVTAPLRPATEPVRWMISDFRAMSTSETDHLWTRILDVPRALEARSYANSGRIVLGVTDDLGFADGDWAIDVDGRGVATVSRVTDETPAVRLGVNDLSAIFLGGVSALTLAQAGRILGDATELDRLFRWPGTAWSSIWF